MKSPKPCSTPSCPYKRLGQRKYCYRCLTAKERLKRLERANRAKERHTKSKGYLKSETRKWHRKCWVLMSEWVRRKDADWRGYVNCYTCLRYLPWKELHCGHLFHGKLDFDPRNLKPQDAACNTYRGGMLNEYAARFIKENGLEVYERLRHDASIHLGYSLEDLKEIHADLTKKLSDLKT